MSPLERIVAACGGVLLDNGARALIPGPDHSHKDRSVSLALTEDGRVLIHCFSPKDNWREVRRALAQRGLLSDDAREHATEGAWSGAKIVAQPSDESRIARAVRIWEESLPLHGTLAAIYLRKRAIADSALTPALRFHPRMTSIDDRLRRPALVAAITGLQGDVQGVQVTLLTAHGASKALVATPRRVIGKLAGGTVQLADCQDSLVIGEGVETMLSAGAALQAPAWAALTAQNLSVFSPPPQVRHLLVASDDDDAGRLAFAAIRDRLANHIRVEAHAPPDGANDWNAWARMRG